MDNKISINDLLKKSPKEIKEILKKEGNTSIEDKQFDEWWSIFELTRICEKYELSELEKWCVLRGRFKIAPLIDPTPSTVESPFSKNQLKAIHNWANNNNEIEIARTCAHLLTNANEWPKEMLVGDHESSLKPCNVIYADPMNRFFVTKDEGDSDYYTWKICRPIEQKPKELSEIIKPKQKCYCIEAFSRYNFMDEAIFCEIFDDKVYIRKAGEEESKWITVSHFNSSFTLNPTPEQITAAEEAAINEVKQRFDKARKEVGMDNIAKFVECIEKPNETFTMRNVTVGKDYEVVSEDSHDYRLIDDNGETWYYIRTCFKEKEATNEI